MRERKTLIIGLGNPFLTDDGVGVKVAAEVNAALPVALRPNVTVTEASVGGLRLMEMMIGYDQVILVDALVLKNGDQPGTIHKLTLDDLREISPTQHSASVHDTTLITAIEMGNQLGFHLPEVIDIFAIEVENVTEFNERPTPAVQAAIPQATAAVLTALALRN